MPLLGLHAICSDCIYSAFTQIDQTHVVAVVGFIIVSVDDRTLTTHGVVTRHQRLCRCWVIDHAAYLLAIHIAGQLIGFRVKGHIRKTTDCDKAFFFD